MTVLGIDTSNYSTSAALYDGRDVKNISRLLPVKKGERGLRQSDAVFHHTKQLPEVMKELFEGFEGSVDCIGVPVSPTPQKGSYMPCFLCGEGLARSIASVSRIPVCCLSHQEGHIMAALFSAQKLSFIDEKQQFIAFHVSGGTTESVLCTPADSGKLFSVQLINRSLDLKAGQLIDRTGVFMGLDFPCGREIEKLAAQCRDAIKVRPSAGAGGISLSGFENKVKSFIESGKDRSYIAKYVLTAVYESIAVLTEDAREKAGDLPVICSGGVMSDIIIQDMLKERFENIYFSAPELSRDNAAGAALYASYMSAHSSSLCDRVGTPQTPDDVFRQRV